MMAALILARHFPERRKQFEEVMLEYLAIVDRALCECDPKALNTQAFYDDAETRLRAQADLHWLKTFQAEKKGPNEKPGTTST
jgi:hypothetical protein